jgi:hypothetical protein
MPANACPETFEAMDACFRKKSDSRCYHQVESLGSTYFTARDDFSLLHRSFGVSILEADES